MALLRMALLRMALLRMALLRMMRILSLRDRLPVCDLSRSDCAPSCPFAQPESLLLLDPSGLDLRLLPKVLGRPARMMTPLMLRDLLTALRFCSCSRR